MPRCSRARAASTSGSSGISGAASRFFRRTSFSGERPSRSPTSLMLSFSASRADSALVDARSASSVSRSRRRRAFQCATSSARAGGGRRTSSTKSISNGSSTIRASAARSRCRACRSVRPWPRQAAAAGHARHPVAGGAPAIDDAMLGHAPTRLRLSGRRLGHDDPEHEVHQDPREGRGEDRDQDVQEADHGGVPAEGLGQASADARRSSGCDDFGGVPWRSFYHTRQAFSRTIGGPALQANAFWNSGMFETTPFTR